MPPAERPLLQPPVIKPIEGRLGVLTVGMGAVASTLVAGVELAKRGMGEPIGSLTQMGTVRLGKRTEHNVPLIKDFVPIASLDDLVFGCWDPFPDDAYVAAQRAGVLDAGRHLETGRRGPARGAADEGRLRLPLREAPRRAEREGGRQQTGDARGPARGHQHLPRAASSSIAS